MDIDNFLTSSEDEGEDSAAHAKLLSDVQGIVNKKSRRTSNSKLRWATPGGTGVDLGAVAALNRNIGGSFNTNSSNFKEAAPSTKQQQKRLARHDGFSAMAEEVNKYAGVVKQMNNAATLTFPLDDKNAISLIDMVNAKPVLKTKMAQEVYALLDGPAMEPKMDAEDAAVVEAMSLEIVQERNREAWRLKQLRDRQGMKAHLRNKTKSKKYHRILKKDKMKQQALQLEKLQKEEPERALDKIQKLEDIRIEERMSLKHKKSKWADKLQLRAKTDKNALIALQENSRMHQELVTKLKTAEGEADREGDDGSSSNSDDGCNEEDPEAVTHNATPAPGVENESYRKMKSFWSEYNKQCEQGNKEKLEEAINRRKEAAVKGKDGTVIEQANHIIKTKLAAAKTIKKNKKKKQETDDDSSSSDETLTERPTITEYEFNFRSNKPDQPMNEVANRLRTLEDMDNLGTKNFVSLAATAKADLTTTKEEQREEPQRMLEMNKIKMMETRALESAVGAGELFDDDSDQDEEVRDDLFDEQDEATQQFNKEKAAAEEAAQPKDECVALPGWGEWVGPDIKMSETKRKRFTTKAPKKKPSAFDKSNVIYNEEADLNLKIRSRMVSELPHPFLSVADYEASMRGPSSRMFMPETMHRRVIAPPLEIPLGHVIKPMDQNQLFKQHEVKLAVTKKLERMKKQDKEADKPDGATDEKVVNRIGNQVMDLGMNKKRKFSRKSVT